jgi:hypothetical protein
MKIKYVQGDLFKNIPGKESGKTIFIPHCCNTYGVMGSGFVLPLLKHFPGVDTEYSKYCKKHKDKSLGYFDFFVRDNCVISNMIAQSGVVGPNNPKPIKYVALAECMNQVRDLVIDYYNVSNNKLIKNKQISQTKRSTIERHSSYTIFVQ